MAIPFTFGAPVGNLGVETGTQGVSSLTQGVATSTVLLMDLSVYSFPIKQQ